LSRWSGCGLEVASALHEAESSRARAWVEIGYEERRRLEKDLHDGASNGWSPWEWDSGSRQRHLDDGTVDVDALLDQRRGRTGTAVPGAAPDRHGLRPSSLDDGLPAALSSLVRSVP